MTELTAPLIVLLFGGGLVIGVAIGSLKEWKENYERFKKQKSEKVKEE